MGTEWEAARTGSDKSWLSSFLCPSNTEKPSAAFRGRAVAKKWRHTEHLSRGPTQQSLLFSISSPATKDKGPASCVTAAKQPFSSFSGCWTVCGQMMWCPHSIPRRDTLQKAHPSNPCHYSCTSHCLLITAAATHPLYLQRRRWWRWFCGMAWSSSLGDSAFWGFCCFVKMQQELF